MKNEPDPKVSIFARIQTVTRDAINEIADEENRTFSAMVSLLLDQVVAIRALEPARRKKKVS